MREVISPLPNTPPSVVLS